MERMTAHDFGTQTSWAKILIAATSNREEDCAQKHRPAGSLVWTPFDYKCPDRRNDRVLSPSAIGNHDELNRQLAFFLATIPDTAP